MTTSPGPSGAIHDIGYRHYDGPRLGPTYIARSLFVHSLRGAFGLGRSARTKVMPMLLLAVMVLPALIIAAVAIISGDSKQPTEYTAYAVNLQIVFSIFVASQAPQSVSRDLRYRVVALYFSRPLSRHAYVQAKLLALSAALFILLAVPLLVIYGGALLAQMAFWSNTRGFLTSLVGAVVFAVVLASIGLVIAAFTPRRGLGVAAIVGVLIVLSGIGATVYNIAENQNSHTVVNGVTQDPSTLANYAGLISPFTLVDGVQTWALGAKSSTDITPPGTTGGIVYVLVTIALVAACYGLLVRRYRRVSVS
jgi:ABC-2 type transport system permease protein